MEFIAEHGYGRETFAKSLLGGVERFAGRMPSDADSAVIEILPTKSMSEYERISESYSLDPATTWMIGNSPRSDIHPALEAGFGAIHIPHAETWSHEHEDLISHPKLMSLSTFSELVRHF